jgi:glycosyltransferase involved in cell wall biosynthesis
MKISIIHPSRSRPAQAKATMLHWLGNLSRENEIEYIISVDSDDPRKEDYLAFMGCDVIVVDGNKNLVQAANTAAKESSGDIIILVSDDFECFKNWDVAIVKAMEGKSGVLKTFDGVQKWIVTLPILSRDYYESHGYIYHPDYAHMFSDSHMTHVADLQKKLIIRNDIVFRHNHYSVKNGVKKDDLNTRADLTMSSGEVAYMKHVQNKFGLDVNILNLSKEAHQAGHVNWLKKRMK